MSARPADFRLATGQSIEDGGGTKRIEINSTSTHINDDSGNLAFSAFDSTDIVGRSGQPIKFFDDNGGFDAIKYNTSASTPGTFQLTNAKFEMYPENNSTLQDFFVPSNNADSNRYTFDINFWTTKDNNYNYPGARIRYHERPGTSNFSNYVRTGEIEFNLWSNWDGDDVEGYKQTALYMRPGQATGDSPKVGIGAKPNPSGVLQVYTDDGNATSPSLSIRDNGNLRLATGQAIEGGSGTARIDVDFDGTRIRNENGTRAFIARRGNGAGPNTMFTRDGEAAFNAYESTDNSGVQIRAYSGDFFLQDRVGDFDAIKYNTSASRPGTLELTNADFKSPNSTIVGGDFTSLPQSLLESQRVSTSNSNAIRMNALEKSIGTSSTDIGINASTDEGAVGFVSGQKTDGNSFEYFMDRVIYSGRGPSVRDTNEIQVNGPDGRTYSATGGGVELAMDSGTYQVTVMWFRLPT
jgi:hypothetical protein